MVHLSRIRIYPIKSLPGYDLDEASLLPSGALRNDRRYALVDDEGKIFNGKRSPAIHGLQSRFPNDCRVVQFSSAAGAECEFHFIQQREEISRWLSEFFGLSLRLIENAEAGFPDDTEASGPTLVSRGSLQMAANWFSEISEDEMRSRMRANLEIDGCPPFWEDQLFSAPGKEVPFVIGSVHFVGVNPCARCALPSRDSRTGHVMSGFQQRFIERREATLSPSTDRDAFSHWYRFALNTRSSGNGVLRLGDVLEISKGSR